MPSWSALIRAEKDIIETCESGTQCGTADVIPDGQRAHAEGTPVPGEPSIPMQTLSRDQAGLKPPGYEQSVQPASNGASGSRMT